MSVVQISCLLDFMEGQPDLALGRCTRTKEGRDVSRKLWQECASILNNVSSDGVQKTAEQWRLFYNEYKHKVLKKFKAAKVERVSTGGISQPKVTPLTPLQERLHNILEREVDELHPEVRQKFHNQLSNTAQESSDNDSVDASNQCSPMMNDPLHTTSNRLKRNRSLDSDVNISDYRFTGEEIHLGDEFKVFGDYVASQLRQLSTEESILARDKINSILTQSRLKDLKHKNCK